MDTRPALAASRLVTHSFLTAIGVLLILGNLLDALFTFTLLQLQLVVEANPFMRWMYEGSPLSFMVAKLGCVQLGFLLLWAHRHVAAAQIAMVAGATMYTAIVAYHLCILALLPSLLRS
jgi:hypothetical protein